MSLNSLLALSAGVDLLASALVILLFWGPLRKIFHRLIGGDAGNAWHKVAVLVLSILGIAWSIDLSGLIYVVRPPGSSVPSEIDYAMWFPAVAHKLSWTIGTLGFVALSIFIFALIAVVIVRGLEIRARGRPETDSAA